MSRSGSSYLGMQLFANYHFKGVQTKMGERVVCSYKCKNKSSDRKTVLAKCLQPRNVFIKGK